MVALAAPLRATIVYGVLLGTPHPTILRHFIHTRIICVKYMDTLRWSGDDSFCDRYYANCS